MLVLLFAKFLLGWRHEPRLGRHVHALVRQIFPCELVLRLLRLKGVAAAFGELGRDGSYQG